MFDKNFFPTPPGLIEIMTAGEDLTGKILLDPSAGKGDIIDFCAGAGAALLLACETNTDLRMILASKCNLIGDDFLRITSEQVSHVDLIIMNPPFDAADKHILHAYNIAPPGCKIKAVCNSQTLKNTHTHTRRELTGVIERAGSFTHLGPMFEDSERKTSVEVSLIKLQKAGTSYKAEFAGFFMDEEPEQDGEVSGLMSYNFIRDLVQRYIGAIKIFDEQLMIGEKMRAMTSGFFASDLSFSCSQDGKPKLRNDFKKDLQKSAWRYIFDKLNINKIATKGLREDINKFIETQTAVPFTMQNIFVMLEIVVKTTDQRMDKAIIEVFDRLTMHYHENRFNLPGWKTNDCYLMGQKFILPMNSTYYDLVEDLIKALCFVTGDNYDDFISLKDFIQYDFKLKDTHTKKYIRNAYGYGHECFHTWERANERREELHKKGIIAEIQQDITATGVWFEWGYFKIKRFKKGTIHFVFKKESVWSAVNQRIAKIKGYPLFEHTHKEAKKYTHTAPKHAKTGPRVATAPGKVLFTIKTTATV